MIQKVRTIFIGTKARKRWRIISQYKHPILVEWWSWWTKAIHHYIIWFAH